MERKTRKKKEVGRWTRQEHARFVEAIMKYGKNWKEVQQTVSTRSTAQVRSHAQKFFNRLSKQQRSIILPNEIEEEVLPQEQKPSKQEKMEQEIQDQPLKSINDVQNQDSSSSSDQQQPLKFIESQEGPPRLLQLIKKQSNEGKNKVGIKSFIQKLNSETQNIDQDIIKKKSSSQSVEMQEEIKDLQRSKNHHTNLSNLLIAYIALSQSQQSLDESFFRALLRKQRKYIYRNQFFKLIDLPKKQDVKNQIQPEPEPRKKSFSLIETEERMSSTHHERMEIEENKNQEISEMLGNEKPTSSHHNSENPK